LLSKLKRDKMTSSMVSRKNSSGFTIVELLIAMIVIGILATVVTVGYSGVRQRAIDTGVMKDVETMEALQTDYGIDNQTGGKAYNSEVEEYDADLDFSPSPGNVIRVWVDDVDFCIAGYNPAGSRENLAEAYKIESSDGFCAGSIGS